MIVNAREIASNEPSPPPQPYTVTISATDYLNSLNTMLTSAGELRVDGQKISSNGQSITVEGLHIAVSYKLNRTLKTGRRIRVNGEVLGDIQTIGDLVEANVSKTDIITVDFLQIS